MAYSNLTKLLHMTSTVTIERAKFQNPPLLNLLLKLSVTFKVLYISPPTSVKIQSTFSKGQQAGESYQTELENYKQELKLLNSDEDPEWMENYLEEALQIPYDAWGPIGYISNEITPPVANAKTKRKFSDIMSSNTRYSQGGTFLPSDQSAEADEVQDATEDEDEDDEDYDEENDEENDQPPLSRRRLD